MGEKEYFLGIEKCLVHIVSRHDDEEIARLLLETQERIRRIDNPDGYEISVRA